MKDLNFYIKMYKDYLKIESMKELKEHRFWLGNKLWDKENDLILFKYMNVNDDSKGKLENEIDDLKTQIKAIKIVLEELK